jgi:hypothetical protein
VRTSAAEADGLYRRAEMCYRLRHSAGEDLEGAALDVSRAIRLTEDRATESALLVWQQELVALRVKYVHLQHELDKFSDKFSQTRSTAAHRRQR